MDAEIWKKQLSFQPIGTLAQLNLLNGSPDNGSIRLIVQSLTSPILYSAG